MKPKHRFYDLTREELEKLGEERKLSNAVEFKKKYKVSSNVCIDLFGIKQKRKSFDKQEYKKQITILDRNNIKNTIQIVCNHLNIKEIQAKKLLTEYTLTEILNGDNKNGVINIPNLIKL